MFRRFGAQPPVEGRPGITGVGRRLVVREGEEELEGEHGALRDEAVVADEKVA